MVLMFLVVLLPGFPLLLMFGFMAARVLGLTEVSFVPLMWMGNLYYTLPARLFGESLFAAGAIGIYPTTAGYALAALLYGLAALVLSFPTCSLLRRLQFIPGGLKSNH